MFILRLGCNRNVFYLYTVTSAACSSTLNYTWLCKGCGYYVDLSVPYILAVFHISSFNPHSPPPPKRKKRAPESSATEAGWTISIDDKCIKVKFLGLEHTFIPTD